MQITYHCFENGSYSIGIQESLFTPVYYYPAIKISTGTIYPVVDNYDQIDNLLKLGLFKPKNTTERRVLTEYNLLNYSRSEEVERLMNNKMKLVPPMEKSADEVCEMENLGIVFKPLK